MPARCASNASATETAYSPAKPREAPVVRLTMTFLIMPSSPNGAASRSRRSRSRPDATVLGRRGFDPGQSSSTVTNPSLLVAVRPELLEIGPQILGFLLVLDAREHHFGPRDFCARILLVVPDSLLLPGGGGPA